MLSKLTIKKKLIFGFIVPFLISAFVIISAITGMRTVRESFDQYSKGPSSARYISAKILADINATAKSYRDLIILNDKQSIDNTVKSIHQNIDLLKEEIDILYDLIEDEESAINSFQNSINDWFKVAEKTLASVENDDIEKARNIIIEEAGPALGIVEKRQDDLQNYVDKITERATIELVTYISKLNIAILSAIAVIFVISILIAYNIIKSVMDPIDALTKLSKELKKGNLQADLSYKSEDEMGQLSNELKDTIDNWVQYIEEISLNLGKLGEGNLNLETNLEYMGDFSKIKISMDKIIESLNDTITQIKSSSDQVSSGADQVSSGSQSLAQGAAEQASSVDELALSISEISKQVNENATNAKSANHMSIDISEKLDSSSLQMKQMISAMELITLKSNEINKIIKTIEDIAFNTNILALNAAVEAARAGNAGKGFAVVADEVRNLASKSSEAAKNTTALIEDSIKAVESGTQIASATAESLYDVVSGAGDISNLINKIASASEEQASSISQVTMGIDQISSVVQTNSATSEESAAASEELSSQANMLKSLVTRFKLKNNNNNAMINNYSIEDNNIISDEFFDDFNIISKY
ncbi:MAG: methyl-accepting chemotaxis protein [Oscillospiraceae bacterium]